MQNSSRQIARVTPLILTDMAIAFVAFLMAYILRLRPDISLEYFQTNAVFEAYTPILLLIPFVRVFTYSLFGVYDPSTQSESTSHRLFNMCKAITTGTVIVILVEFMYRGVFDHAFFTENRVSRGMLLIDWFLNILLVCGVHGISMYVRGKMFERGIGKRNIAIQGSGGQASVFNTELGFLKSSQYSVKGYIAGEDAKDAFSEIEYFEYLGSPDRILEIINRYELDEIIVTDVGSLGMDLVSFVAECHKRDVIVKLALDIYGVLTHGRQLNQLGGQPVIQINDVAIEGFARVLKRTEDIVLCSIALAITLPLWCLIGFLIKRESPGPAIFNQLRVGKNGRTFLMHKFRSMHLDAEERLDELMDKNEADGLIFKIKEDPRCTTIGKFIRRTNLDEIPQFWNVIKGEMSLVGPRPPLPIEVSQYQEHHKKRLSTTPGITGLWQVNRGHNYNFDEVVNWDMYYIENWSLWLDIKIILKTIGVLITGSYSY